ncbi:MAG: S8 family serine peptidase [Phycisphaerales bacterium]|nr:S8 family serine peptidase [Phycisphaerales bacterium]
MPTLLSILLVTLTTSGGEMPIFDRPHLDGQLLVRFKAEVPGDLRLQALEHVGGQIEEQYWLVPGLLRVSTDQPLPAAAARLSPWAIYVEPVGLVHAVDTVPDDPHWNDLWGMHQIHAAQAWDDHTGEDGFVVAVIDTGIDYTHGDLVDNLWTNPGEIPGNGLDDDGNGYVDDVHGWDFCNDDSDPWDDHGHGTHCSGTVGAQGDNGTGVVGVNWNCRIAGVKFLCASGSGTIGGAIGAIQYCVANEIRVSNNSWSTNSHAGQALKDAIEAAGDQIGHVFVAAAGNDGHEGADWPCAYDSDNIICVAASRSNEERAGFSQYHAQEVDLAAPGVSILSSTPGGGYGHSSGTSMASPHVAGSAALLASLMPWASVSQIKATLLDTARPVPAWKGLCATGGILDVGAAIDAAFLPPMLILNTPLPEEVEPDQPFAVELSIDPRDDSVVAGTVKLHWRDLSLEGWSSADMKHIGKGIWSAQVPGQACEVESGLYMSCEGETAGLVTFPPAGASQPLTWVIGERSVNWWDDCETDTGWSVESTATDGAWTQAIPGDCDDGGPAADFDGSGACWMTGAACNEDVDEGWTMLVSPELIMSGLEAPALSYARWFSNSTGAAPGTDAFTVQVSADNGAWQTLEVVGPLGSDVHGGWIQVEHDLMDLAQGAQQIRIRFTTSDLGPTTQSTVEAAIDALAVTSTVCENPVWGACCIGEDCSNSILLEDCLALGGTLHPQSTCVNVLCGGAQEGACCLGDDCAFLSIDDCFAAGGAFVSVDATCPDVVCDDGIDLPMVSRSIGDALLEGGGESWTRDIYVVIDPGGRIDAVAGTSSHGKMLSSSGTFHQDPFGGPTSMSINPALFKSFPDLRWDSRVTIGSLDASGTPFAENALQVLGMDFDAFEAGGDLVSTDGAWFVLPIDEQGEALEIVADDCTIVHAVPIARLTMLDRADVVTFEGWVQGRTLDGDVFDDVARIELTFSPHSDCNGNEVQDACDIALGSSSDLDGDGVPDECQGACPGDADGDNDTDINDVLMVISWFMTSHAQADVDGSGIVDIDDLLQVIAFFGSC